MHKKSTKAVVIVTGDHVHISVITDLWLINHGMQWACDGHFVQVDVNNYVSK